MPAAKRKKTKKSTAWPILEERRVVALNRRKKTCVVFKVRVHKPQKQTATVWCCGHDVFVGRQLARRGWLFGKTPRQALVRSVKDLLDDLPDLVWRKWLTLSDPQWDELRSIRAALSK